jgi:hypothetical protein
MKPRKVISWKCLPSRPPWQSTVVIVLALDRLHAPAYIWSAVAVVLLAGWAAILVACRNETEVDIFGEKHPHEDLRH